MSEKVIYEKHPISPERKAELRQKGYKIIDARFAPDGYEHPEPTKEEKSKAGGPLKVDEIRAALDAKGVAYGDKAAKPELQKLLDESNKADEIKAKLTEKGVDFSAAVTLEDLQKLLDEAA
ncbi:hypothetical protein VA602_18025 [Pseudomonas sp. MH2]|uniref:HeH/LEM domain-containing protein n=1 Tax=Pseudomonas machongensis TaxID=3110229 RepID=A0ABU5VIL9_9PSED|nr:hypothetical protein [Pseudomonas sp. MH2]MEA5673222.1 hypothetical protein [Pseudomonas sp. MH2]